MTKGEIEMIKNLEVNQSKMESLGVHQTKPWMTYYADRTYKMFLPNTNIADYLRQKTVGLEKMTAETYYTRKISFEETFSRVDSASRALTGLGVKQGDILFTLMPNIPESGNIWLGASQIGAIVDFADPRPDSMDLLANAKKVLEMIRFEQANYIVALDRCYTAMLKPIENELKDFGIQNIIVVSASDSMTIRGIIDYLIDVIKYNQLRNARMAADATKKLRFYQALLMKIQGMKQDKVALNEAIASSPIEIIRYQDLVKECQNVPFAEIKDENLVSYIGHTSGTSGARPKPIPLTNKNQIFATEQVFKAGVNVGVGDRVIHELPFFSPLGSNNNFLIDMASGANLFDVPEFEINEFGYLIKKYKPNVFLGTPSWLSSLPKCSYLKKTNLSCIKRAIYGGDSMSRNEEIELHEWLRSHGSSSEVEKGHGMSEYCGGGTYAAGKWNCYESIGIPFPDTIYGIVDPNIEDRLVPVVDKDEDGFISGELVVSSDAVTSGILHGNQIVSHYELDGKSYIRTRDLVKMREDGVFFFQARKDRSFTRFDGYKVKPAEIEKEIEKNPNVDICRVTYYYDEEKKGLMPIAHIVLSDSAIQSSEEYVRIAEEIIQEQIIANQDMSSRQIPSRIKFRSSIPLTKNSKFDINALVSEGLDGTEVVVNVEETNLFVGKITVLPPQQKSKIKCKVKE